MYKSIELQVNKLLMEVLQRGASDLHLVAGKPPTLRVDSGLVELKNYEIMSGEIIANMLDVLFNSETKSKQYELERDIDFSFSFKDNVRFRVNAYYQKGFSAAALRLIPNKIPTIEELNLPLQLQDFLAFPQGLVLRVPKEEEL